MSSRTPRTRAEEIVEQLREDEELRREFQEALGPWAGRRKVLEGLGKAGVALGTGGALYSLLTQQAEGRTTYGDGMISTDVGTLDLPPISTENVFIGPTNFSIYDNPIKTIGIGMVTLGNGETFTLWRATLPAGKQIKVIEAGIYPAAVTGLSIEAYNQTDLVSIYSNNAGYDDGSYGTPLASGGIGDDVEIRINNASGVTQDASAWVTFVVE